MEFTPGLQIGGRYIVDRELGRGGFAAVFAARHVTLGSTHALKVLHTATPSQSQRLLSEGRAQAQLRHPNIVSVTDVVELDNHVVLVLEYIDGPTLEACCAARRLTIGEIDLVVRSLLLGIEAAHGLGLVHRDLKPANVLMDSAGSLILPKIADFGLVKMLDSTDGQTATGMGMGTPAYMSPEQFTSASTVDERTDIYSLGAMLYELFTGRQASIGSTWYEIASIAETANRPSVIELAPETPPRLAALVEQALSPDQDERPRSVSDLLRRWNQAAVKDDSAHESLSRLLAGIADGQYEPALDATMTSELPSSIASVQRTPEVTATIDPVELGQRPPSAAPANPSKGPRLLGAAIGVGLILGAGAWFLKPPPAIEPGKMEMFTAEVAPTLYEDPTKQRQIERTWSSYREGEHIQAGQALRPLLESAPYPAETVFFSMLLAGQLNLNAQKTHEILLDGTVREGEGRTGTDVCIDAYQTGFIEGQLRQMDPEKMRANFVENNAGLREWIQANPTDLLAVLCLTHGGLATGEEAILMLEAADPAGSTPMVVHDLAMRLAGRGQLDDASERVAKARQDNPHSIMLMMADAMLMQSRGDRTAAAAVFETASKERPSRWDIRREASKLAITMGDDEVLGRHLTALTAADWGSGQAMVTANDLVEPLLQSGRANLVRELAIRAGLQGNPTAIMTRQYAIFPGYYSKAQLDWYAAGITEILDRDGAIVETGRREDARSYAAAFRLLGQLREPQPQIPDAMLQEALRGPGIFEGERWVSAWGGDIAALDSLVGTPGMRHQVPPPPGCELAYLRAAFTDRAGLVEEAVPLYLEYSQRSDCSVPRSRAQLALSAGALALAAFRRENKAEAEKWIARYHELWPTADSTLVIARDLEAFGVRTGPGRQSILGLD